MVGVAGVKVYADQYGETYINKRFEIDKDVRIEGDNSWKDKVTDVEINEIVEFKITIKNRSDEEADDFDNMKMEDFLPDELERVGGSGLTEYWDNFEPGEKKSFTIEAKVKDSEYDREDNFEKCVVNKAEVEWDGEFEGSDTAIVCYGNTELTELPETGSSTDSIAALGLGLVVVGALVKKLKKNKVW